MFNLEDNDSLLNNDVIAQTRGNRTLIEKYSNDQRSCLDEVNKLDAFLKNSEVIKLSFITVGRIMSLLNKISLKNLGKVSFKCREYKKAIIYFEEYERKNADFEERAKVNKNFHSKNHKKLAESYLIVDEKDFSENYFNRYLNDDSVHESDICAFQLDASGNSDLDNKKNSELFNLVGANKNEIP